MSTPACAKCGETQGAQVPPVGKVWLCDRCDHEMELTLKEGVMITISLEIENTYELYEDVTTHKTDVQVPAPPTERDSQDFDDWEQEHIYPLTGVGNEKGDSWHDVTVTASSDPDLLAVGATFEFGY